METQVQKMLHGFTPSQGRITQKDSQHLNFYNAMHGLGATIFS